jgi:hypothetical protein
MLLFLAVPYATPLVCGPEAPQQAHSHAGCPPPAGDAWTSAPEQPACHLAACAAAPGATIVAAGDDAQPQTTPASPRLDATTLLDTPFAPATPPPRV